MMKRKVTERVLVLILSIAVLLSSTGVYSVFAETYSNAVSETLSTTESSSSADSESVTESQETTASASEEETTAAPNVVAEGGSVENGRLKGAGTESNPYLVSDADDFFKMQDIINDSNSADKFFVLNDDIDLSQVSYSDLKENSVFPGTVVSVDKSKSDASSNTVRFTLNGKNHKIYGLNVDNTGSDGAAVFGYIGSKSVIENVRFENITIDVMNKKAVVNSAIAVYNNGVIRNCEIKAVRINVFDRGNSNTDSKTVNGSLIIKESTGFIGINGGEISDIEITRAVIHSEAEKNNIGVVAGINTGKISQVKVSATVETAYSGAVGGIAGKNTGRIEASTVDDIKATVGSGSIFGGVAGKNTGSIVSCVTSGKVSGSEYAGGIAGKSSGSNSKVRDCYAFVAVPSSSETGAVVALGETCGVGNVWSSQVSGRDKAYADGTADGNICDDAKYIIVKKNEVKTVSKSSFAGSCGKARYAFDTFSKVRFEGSGISCEKTRDGISITASKAGETGTVTYTLRVAVESGYKNSAVVSVKDSVTVLTFSDSNGDGMSETSPLEINSGAELCMISKVPYAHFSLGKDITMPEKYDSSFSLTGSFNGNGHKVYAVKPFCQTVSGKIKNLDAVLKGEIKTAMFGDAENALISNVRLTKGAKSEDNSFVGFSAKKSGTAAFINKVSGKTVVENCFCNIPVYVGTNEISNIAGFIGVLDGNYAVVKSCGVSASVTSKNDNNIAGSAAFIGKVSGSANTLVKDCYATLYSDVVKYVLIGSGNAGVKVENTNYGASNKKAAAAPSKFKNIDAEKWTFESGKDGFISGKGGVVSIVLPSGIIDADEAEVKDFKVMFDGEELSVDRDGIEIKGGVAYIPVKAAKEGTTVRNSSLVFVHKETGLRAEISISNGLVKDADGNYLISNGTDFTYINDNFDKLKDKSFIITKDIDMSDVNFKAVGGAAGAFEGKIDGGDCSIIGFNSESETKTALFGTLNGAVIKNITFKNAVIKSEGSYAGVLAAQIKGKTTVENVSFKDCKVSTDENYAGVLAGEINNSSVKNVKITDCEVKAMNNSGILAGGIKSAKLEKISVNNAAAAGDNDVGIIGRANDSTVKSVVVKNSKLTAEETVGGVIADAEDVKLSNIVVKGIKIIAKSDVLGSAPVAGGICGVFGGTLKNADVKSSQIKTEGNAAVAGGVVGISENSKIKSADIDKKVSVKAAVAGGVVGEAADSTTVSDSKSFAAVKGSESATKVIEGTGGIIGRVSADNFSSVKINNTNAAGSVSAADYAGGVIGSVLSQDVDGVSVKNCVISAKINETVPDEKITSGHVVGYVAYLSEKEVSKAVDGIVFSSYASGLGAYGNVNAPETYHDLDSAVKSSLSGTIKGEKTLTVKVTNSAADELGFKFDKDSGWRSDSEERVGIIASSENKVKLSTAEAGKVAIVGTYKLSSDEEIALDVHFDTVADIDILLKGDGTKESPYIISNALELEAVSEYVGEKAYFELADDIVFSEDDFKFGGEFYNEGKGFKVIGSKESPFDGVFNGNGHKVSGIVINGVEFGGLFGYTDGAEIFDITVTKSDIEADILAAGIAANIKDTVIADVKVSDTSVTAVSAEGNAAAVAAYAEASTVKNAEIISVSVEACKSDSAYDVAYAGAVCARAIDTVIENAAVDGETEVVSDGIAAGIAGYCDKVKVIGSETFAAVGGCAAASIAGSVRGTLEINDTVAGGKVSADEFAAGVAAKACAPIKAENVVVSAEISGEGDNAVVAAYADESVFTDSAECEVDFSDIIYSSYQNNAKAFASEKINSYQSSAYLNSVIDVNKVTAKDGGILVIGKDKTVVSQAVKSEYDLSKFSCDDIYSEPENLIVYDKADGTVKAVGTNSDGAKLVIKYSNGLEVAVDMVCIEGMSGEGTKASPFIIENEQTLKILKVYPDAVFTITKDINLSEEWIPVDDFSGKLDGAGFEISGLKVSADNAGLFASLSGDAEVKNITFKDASVEGKTAAAVVAANVTDNAKISGISVISSSIKAEDYAAAVAGVVQVDNSKAEDCKVSGCTVSAKNAGGIAALVLGKCEISSANVEDSEINGADAAGGIVAVSSAEGSLICDCEVSAEISAANAGGIAGIAEKAVAVSKCTVNGAVSGTEAEGGAIGYAYDNVSVKGSRIFAVLSGKAKNTAEIVGKFAVRPNDDEKFTENFTDNIISGEYDEFEPAVMQYQNYVYSDRETEALSLNGSGTEEDPYVISSAEDLSKIPVYSMDYFVLKNDITLTANDYGISIDSTGETVYGALRDGYKPIKNFAGVFDGQNHVIKGLYINSDSDFVGLFGKVTAAGLVKNLHIELLEASDGFGYSGIKGKSYVGGIAGYCDSSKGIRNCSVIGSTIVGENAVGGIAGGVASSKIVSSFAKSEITAQNRAGGLVGITAGDSSVTGSFTACKVNGTSGSLIGTNNGNLVLTDVMTNGTSHGIGFVAVAVNNGSIKAERVLIAGVNEDKKTTILYADEMRYVYSDKTTLGVTEKDITALTTSQLVSSKPKGLEEWNQIEGTYPVPVMEDEYSNKQAAIAALPADKASFEVSTGNVTVNYNLKNRTGDRAVDSMITGVLIKSGVGGTAVTSDFFTTCGSEIKPINRILVATGGFYVASSLPMGYRFSVSATDSEGMTIKVSDAGSNGWYVESGAEEEVNLDISIVKTETTWGVFSLWESLAR